MTSTYDQARRLRELMRDARSRQRPSGSRPPIVAVVGGCPADRVSSIAVELAEELGRQTVKVNLTTASALDEIESTDIEIQLVDAGVGLTAVSSSIWHQADLVLSVFSASRESLLATYFALKSALVERPHLPVWLVPNQCADGQAAEELHERVSACCKRFLGRAIQAAPWLPTTIIDSTTPCDSEQFRRLAGFVHCQVLVPAVEQEIALTGSIV